MPPSDPFIQQLDPFDLEFVEWSLVCDDPKLLEQIQNRYYDPEFDAWMEEFDKEQEEQQRQQAKTSPSVEMPDAETVEWNNRKSPPTRQLPMEEYEMGDTSQFADETWERED